MARIRSRIGRAAATHRQAAAVAAAAGAALDRWAPDPRPHTDECALRELAEQLRVTGSRVAPGWLGAGLDAAPASTPLGDAAHPRFVRVGTAQPLDDASFPVVVPLGHLAFGADARDGRVAGALQAVLLRLLAAAPASSLLVRAVDPTGTVFGGFAPLHDAGIMPPPVTDRAGLLAVLTEAEQWVRGGSRTRTLLLVVAGWPQQTTPDDLTRVSALANDGPAAGLHLVVASWPPPPPLATSPTGAALPHATQVMLRNPHVRLGQPPGGSFAAPVPAGQTPSPGLNAKVYLDDPPPPELVARVCRSLARRAADDARVALGDLLPDDDIWTHDAAAGLAATLGWASDAPVTLRLNDLTPHWLIGGRSGSGKTTLLLWILYGLCSRYGPDQLCVHLLDLTGAGSFADFVPSANDRSRLPHAAVVGLAPDQEHALTVLRGLVVSLVERSEVMREAGVERFTDARAAGVPLPRILCVIDDYQPLLGSTEATSLLQLLLHQGGECGIHTVLASRDTPEAQTRYGDRESTFGRCRVRIALPGGSGVLDGANDAAAGLPLGAAVVNTAGGLGGPRGATRAHEQVVRFPDPYADPVTLAGLRHRLWRGTA